MTDDKEALWAKIRLRQSVDDLIKHGPTISIGIAPSPFLGSGMTTVLAQIDTGAAGCGLSLRMAKRLALKPIDTGELREAGRKPIIVPYFRVRLFLPATEIETDIVGLSTLDPPHDVLIGRDVLASCRLAVDFTSGTVCLHIKNNS